MADIDKILKDDTINKTVKNIVDSAEQPAPEQLDLSKVQMGTTVDMARSFKEQFGRDPNQQELIQLVGKRAEAKGAAPTFPATGGEFSPAQDIARSQALADELKAAGTFQDQAPPVMQEPELPPFTAGDIGEVPSEALADTEAVSRLKSISQIEEKYFEEQGALNKEITDIESQIKKYKQSAQAGLDLIEDQAIPMGFITGQQASLERRANRQLQTLADLQSVALRKKELATADMDTRLKFITAARLEDEFQMKKEEFQTEQMMTRLELIAKVGGTPTETDKKYFDGKYGQGWLEKYMTVTKEAAEVEAQGNEIKVAKDIVDILSKIPSGQEIDIGNATYTGIKELDPTKGLYVFTETINGQVTQVTTKYNPTTGQNEVLSINSLGKADTGDGDGSGMTPSKLITAKGNYYAQNPDASPDAFDMLTETEKAVWYTGGPKVSTQQFLTKDSIKAAYPGKSLDAYVVNTYVGEGASEKDIKDAAKAAGFRSTWTSWETEKQNYINDLKEQYIDYLWSDIETRRARGETDADINKELF